MILDKLTERPLNIKGLILEEPKPLLANEFKIAPGIELTEEDWKNMVNSFKITEQLINPNELARLANNTWSLQFLFPRRFNHQFPAGKLPWSNDVREDFVYNIKPRMGGASTNRYVYDLKSLGVVKSEDLTEDLFATAIASIDRDESEIRRQFGRGLEDGKLPLYMYERLAYLKLLFPDKFSNSFYDRFGGADTFYSMLDVHLYFTREKVQEAQKASRSQFNSGFGDIETYAYLTTYARIFFPEKKAEVLPKGEDWELFKYGLDYPRQVYRWDKVAQMAVFAKILGADEIEFTDQGLRLVTGKPEHTFTQPLPPMPQVRKF